MTVQVPLANPSRISALDPLMAGENSAAAVVPISSVDTSFHSMFEASKTTDRVPALLLVPSVTT